MLAPGGTNTPQFIPTAVGPGKLSPLGCIEMGRGCVLSPRSFPRTSPALPWSHHLQNPCALLCTDMSTVVV